jgi:hypothetical protein
VRDPRGTRSTPGDTGSDTYRVEPSQREAMEQALMDLGSWLAEHPEAARKNLKPMRSGNLLEPGVYYNRGTGMVERFYSAQHVPLGHHIFRISSDPAASVEKVRRRVLEGKRLWRLDF